MKARVEKQIGKGLFSLEIGHLAKQSMAAVVAQYNDTMVLNALVSGAPRPGIDFFPLTCDYRERTAAAGKFPGGFIKREGRPNTKEILTSRLIDRPLRPLFPDWFKDEVQIQSMVLSSDRQTDADVIAMTGSAAAVHLSPLPFDGPLSSVRVGRVENAFVAFPTQDELEASDLDLIVSGTHSAVLMIEGFAREMPEDDMLAAIMYAHGLIKELCALQDELRARVGQPKQQCVAKPDDGLYAKLHADYHAEFKVVKRGDGKQARAEAVRQLRDRAWQALANPGLSGAGAITVGETSTPAIDAGRFHECWHKLEERVVRDLILEGVRPDGRDLKSLRPIECQVAVLPRTHGSAIFQRGETQALVTVTLGTSRDEQRVDGLIEEYSKKFMLDYNFPSFSVNECRPIRGPGRREIGHGMLAERSVKPVLPNPDDFPYTVRVISDILESNGSSSMASVCGAVLGLMDAGVPISNPVAGISVGLVKEGEDWRLLTDIIGDEDHFGDMDFKIAGTQRGITGIQLDLKINGVSEEIIRATFAQSRDARIQILRSMLTSIPRPRDDISRWAPRLIRTRIDPDKIGALIGPGGKNIRGIQEQTGTIIEVEDDGSVTIASTNKEWADQALSRIEACTATVQIGKIYDGRVTSIKDFGVFVEIVPGRDGLCHVSELSNGYVNSVADVCRVGDTMKVIVIDIDDHDRVKLSRRRALEELGLPDDLETAAGAEGERPRRRPPRDGDDRGGDRGDRGGDRGDRGGDRGDRGGRGGDRDRGRRR